VREAGRAGNEDAKSTTAARMNEPRNAYAVMSYMFMSLRMSDMSLVPLT